MRLYWACRVKGLDDDIRLHDRMRDILEHEIRIITGFIQVKMWVRSLPQLERGPLEQLSLVELARWIEKNTVAQDLQPTKLDQLIADLQSGKWVIPALEPVDDEEVQNILDHINEASLTPASHAVIRGESIENGPAGPGDLLKGESTKILRNSPHERFSRNPAVLEALEAYLQGIDEEQGEESGRAIRDASSELDKYIY